MHPASGPAWAVWLEATSLGVAMRQWLWLYPAVEIAHIVGFVVLETVGAQTWKRSLRSLRKGGRLVTCGATTGPIGETDIRTVFWKQISIIGSTMANRREFNDVMRLFFAGRLKAIVDEVVPLKDGAAAQRRLAEGKQFGKIVLTV